MYKLQPMEILGQLQKIKKKIENIGLKKKHCFLFVFGVLPAVILTHVHQVDALSVQTVAVHVRATLRYGYLSHTWIVFYPNCEGNGKFDTFCCFL